MITDNEKNNPDISNCESDNDEASTDNDGINPLQNQNITDEGGK